MPRRVAAAHVRTRLGKKGKERARASERSEFRSLRVQRLVGRENEERERESEASGVDDEDEDEDEDEEGMKKKTDARPSNQSFRSLLASLPSSRRLFRRPPSSSPSFLLLLLFVFGTGCCCCVCVPRTARHTSSVSFFSESVLQFHFSFPFLTSPPPSPLVSRLSSSSSSLH